MNDAGATLAQPGDTVVVTGASGFIGVAQCEALLAAGMRVRATLRDVTNAAKTEPLRNLQGRYGDALSLHAANLLAPQAFDEVMHGARFVCHLASSVRLAAKDPQRDIVDVAVSGTRHVMQAAVRASRR